MSRQSTLRAKFNKHGGLVALYHSNKWNSVAEMRCHSTREIMTSLVTYAPKIIRIYDCNIRPTQEPKETPPDGGILQYDIGDELQVTALGHYCIRWERTEEQKRIRRIIGDNGGVRFQGKQPALREDECSNTISTVEKDNLILEIKEYARVQ